MPRLSVKDLVAHRPLWDRIGMGLSALCLVHCLALPLVLTGLSAWMATEVVHQWLAVALLVVAALAAVPGYLAHRRPTVPMAFVLGLAAIGGAIWWEAMLGESLHVLLTVLGSLVLIAAHALNWRYRRCTHRTSGEATWHEETCSSPSIRRPCETS